ncbi:MULTISPECIES: hypothetical protein [Oscillospiraceae]|jgi:hypothetical protein|uniref:hypothetical protein n=1 Tax=Oscillospiraceae TaxID=216572 RepID=UPI0004B7F810
MDRYEEDHWIRDWFDANEEMILLHDALCCRQIFRLIQEKDEILSEARTFPEQNSLFPEEDLELGERDREGLAAIGAYKDYLEYPEDYGGEDHIVYQFGDEYYTSSVPRTPIPPESPEKTRALLVAYGQLNVKWAAYKKYCMNYKRLLEDIASVCQTLRAFVRMGFSSLEKLTPNNYVASLHEFLFHERAHKWVTNPAEGTGFYTYMDDVRIHLRLQETAPGSGAFKVYEY